MNKIIKFFKKHWPSVATVITIVFTVCQWDWLVTNSSNGETIRSIALVIAAIWGIYGIAIAALRTIALQKQVSLQEGGQVSERYVRAVELLTSDKQPIKMSGIFILERVAKEADDKTFEDILKSLCAYIRDLCPFPAENDADIPSPYLKREDIQEILKFLSAQSTSEKLAKMTSELSDIGKIIDLSYTNLEGAYFIKGYLNGVNFTGSYLKNAYFEGADLRSANFEGANLGSANFDDANLGSANFECADLCSTMFLRADIQGANFFNANLGSANFIDASIQRANFMNADLHGANFSDTNFEEAKNLQLARGLDTARGLPPDYRTKGTNA